MAYNKKNKGVVRCSDKMGRVVIPKEIRKDLGMDIGSPVEITVFGNQVQIRKYVEYCIICGKPQAGAEMLKIHDKKICDKCSGLIGKYTVTGELPPVDEDEEDE